jgi:hypothetical protein
MLFLAGFAYLLHRWLRRFGVPSFLAAAGAGAVITLPAFQMYVAGGPWLTVPLLLTAAAMHLLYRAADRHGFTQPGLYGLAGGAALLLLAALATYQTSALAALSFLLFALLMTDCGRRQPGDRRFLLLSAGVVFTCVLVYYLTWKAVHALRMPNDVDIRYTPDAILKSGFGERARLFWDYRLPQNLNLWVISWKRSFFYYLTACALLLGVGADLMLGRRRGRSAWRAAADTAVKVVLGAGLLLFSDAFALASGFPTLSFTTTTALTLSIMLAVFWAVRGVVLCLPERWRASPAWRRAVCAAAAVTALTAAGAAQASVTRRLAVPLWLEIALYRDKVREYRRTHPDVSLIRVHIRGVNFGYSREHLHEFTWSNYQHSFYCCWLTRNLLDSMGLDSRVEIEVVDPATKAVAKHPGRKPVPTDAEALEIDFSKMKLH